MRKLTSLVRAGLFDAKKLPMLKRALNKDPKDMTPAERKILIELLDSLMGEVLGSQQVYQKVRQDVMKEELSEAKTSDGYLSKYDPRYDKMPNEKQIPAVIILKRKAIRIYPDNQKVALYYSQALDKYVTIPFGNFEGGNSVNEEVEHFSESRAVEVMPARERFKAKRRLQEEDKDKKQSGWDIAGEIATDVIPGVSNLKSVRDAYSNLKAGNYGKAAIDAALATPAGNIAKWAKAAVKGVKAVAKSSKTSDKVNAPEVPAAPKVELTPKVEPTKTPEPVNVLDNLPGVSSSKTPPSASNVNTPKVETPKSKPTPEELPPPPSSGGKGKQPANANEPEPILGTGTTGPAPKTQKVEPVRKDSYNTGVEITKGPPAGTKPPANVNVSTPPAKAPVTPPSVKTANAPANVGAPSNATVTRNTPAVSPATNPSAAGATGTAPAARLALSRASKKKEGEPPNRRPSLPFSLPDASVDKSRREPAKFSLAAHISKPKGNVRTGVQKREENLFRKSLQKEEADTKVVYKRKVEPAKFGNIRVNTNNPTGNTAVRTGVSARDAMMYRRSLQQNESVLSKLKSINENQSLNLTIGDDSVIINNTVANKILTVYESVSKENKKKIEDMLNESVESVKKIINFVARQ